MPSTYAHRYLGEEVRKCLTGRAAEIIDGNRELFDIGLHGPDILFYHRPLLYGGVNKIGRDMHKEKGSRFFNDAKPLIRESCDEQGALAYILGFICHFAADSQCHPYVDLSVERTGVPHVEIEVELDKMLMVRDGFDPWEFDFASHLKNSEAADKVIGPLLGISERDAGVAVKGMKKYAKFFTTTNPVIRGVCFFFLKVVGLSENIRGMFLNKKEHPACRECSKVLEGKLEEAIPVAVALVENYMEFYQGEAALAERFELKYD